MQISNVTLKLKENEVQMSNEQCAIGMQVSNVTLKLKENEVQMSNVQLECKS